MAEVGTMTVKLDEEARTVLQALEAKLGEISSALRELMGLLGMDEEHGEGG